MNDEAGRKEELIERILDDARGEARQIRDDAKRSIEERRRTLERRLGQIESEADERIEGEEARLTRQADSAIALAGSRARLETEDRVYRGAYAAARERLRAQRPQRADASFDASYDAIVRRWIVEAAIGVGADRVTVAAPAADRVVAARVLEEAERIVRERTGREVTLELDAEADVGGQGVLLRDASGRRAFSNLVDDRMRRLRGEAQRIVYEEAVRALGPTAGEAEAAGGDDDE